MLAGVYDLNLPHCPTVKWTLYLLFRVLLGGWDAGNRAIRARPEPCPCGGAEVGEGSPIRNTNMRSKTLGQDCCWLPDLRSGFMRSPGSRGFRYVSIRALHTRMWSVGQAYAHRTPEVEIGTSCLHNFSDIRQVHANRKRCVGRFGLQKDT